MNWHTVDKNNINTWPPEKKLVLAWFKTPNGGEGYLIGARNDLMFDSYIERSSIKIITHWTELTPPEVK